jgi:hypothetical protein
LILGNTNKINYLCTLILNTNVMAKKTKPTERPVEKTEKKIYKIKVGGKK